MVDGGALCDGSKFGFYDLTVSMDTLVNRLYSTMAVQFSSTDL